MSPMVAISAGCSPYRAARYVGSEQGGGHLVQKWLEGVIVVLVDHGDLHWDPAQGLGGAELGKARSHDHHAGLESAHAGRPLGWSKR